jgi:hypothetical protein
MSKRTAMGKERDGPRGFDGIPVQFQRASTANPPAGAIADTREEDFRLIFGESPMEGGPIALSVKRVLEMRGNAPLR